MAKTAYNVMMIKATITDSINVAAQSGKIIFSCSSIAAVQVFKSNK